MLNVHKNLFLGLVILCACTCVNAQNSLAKALQADHVSEIELKTCLVTEKEAYARFKTLQLRTEELQGIDRLLQAQRIALAERAKKLKASKASQQDMDAFNESINLFNQKADQLNKDKDEFEQKTSEYRTWRNNTLKKHCDPILNKPVLSTTAFYACQYDQDQDLAELPYCKNLEKISALKQCTKKAGSKEKAYEMCLTEPDSQ